MKILLVILGALILVGGAYVGYREYKEDQLFEKKQGCVKYRSDIENKINEGCPEKFRCSLIEVYYNMISNSCEYSREGINIWSIKREDHQAWYFVNDYFSSKEVYFKSCADSDTECKRNAKSAIYELKGQ